jgi:hypothetical protein
MSRMVADVPVTSTVSPSGRWAFAMSRTASIWALAAGAHGVAAVQEEHSRLADALTLVLRDPSGQFQLAVSRAIEDLVGVGRCAQQFVFVGRRALLQKLGAEMVADLGIIALGKPRFIRNVERRCHLRQDECAGKAGQHGTALEEKGIPFIRAHNAAPKSFPRHRRFAPEDRCRQYTSC